MKIKRAVIKNGSLTLSLNDAGYLPCPSFLAPEVKAVWLEITSTLPATWAIAPEMAHLLVRLCTHIARAKLLEEQLTNLDPVKQYDLYRRLSRLSAAETGQILPLSRALRLTATSRMRPEVAAEEAAVHRQRRRIATPDPSGLLT